MNLCVRNRKTREGENGRMKRNGKARALGLLLLTLILAIAAGCQSYGGVDLNKTIKNSLMVTSSESKGSYELELHLNEETLEDYEEEEIEMLQLFSRMKLELHQAKMQDQTSMSVNGSLVLGQEEGISIDFGVQMDEEKLVIELEDAKAPFVFDVTGMGLFEEYGIGMDVQESDSSLDDETLTQIGFDLVDVIGEYGIGNLPNPKDLNVTPVNLPIGGADTQLMRVSFTMDGDELWDWINKYVNALISDRDGLEAMVKGVLEIFEANPELWELLGEMNPIQKGVLDAPTLDDVAADAADVIAEELEYIQEELDYINTEDRETLDLLLGDALQMKLDTYVDGKLDIRKQDFELTYSAGESFEEEMLLPITGFTVRASSEQWSVNGPVKADKPAAADNAVSLEEIEYGYQFLEQINEDSDLHALLTDTFHLNVQSYSSFTDSYMNPPILMPGYIAIVPVKEVADALGAETKYDPATRRVTVYDAVTDTTLVFTPGSDSVLVNGKAEVWPVPVTVIDWTTYVPARKLAEALGAEIEWSTIFEGTSILTIEREL